MKEQVVALVGKNSLYGYHCALGLVVRSDSKGWNPHLIV